MKSKLLQCRSCELRTQHTKTLKYDWGYSCKICQTWQHQSQLFDIQHGYAAQMILKAIKSEDEILWCDGSLDEFIEAARALDFEFDYQQNQDGYDFMAWNPEDDEQVVNIKL